MLSVRRSELIPRGKTWVSPLLIGNGLWSPVEVFRNGGGDLICKLMFGFI